MSLSMTLGGSMPSTLPSLTVGTLEVTGAATFAATITASGNVTLEGQTTFGAAGDGRSYFNLSYGLQLGSGLKFLWSSALDGGSAAADTGIARSAAGVVEVNNGTSGTFRDLKVRALFAANAGGSFSPSITFASQSDEGFGYISATSFGAYVANALKLTFGSTVLTPAVPIITTAIPGTGAAPVFGVNNGGAGASGFYEGSGPALAITVAGGFYAGFRSRVNGVIPGGLLLRSDTLFGWTSTAADSETSDLGMARLGAASLRLGLAPSAAPVAQTFSIGEASRPGTDTNVGGANGTIRSGLGTGTGTPSKLLLLTPTVAASGSGVQTYDSCFVALGGLTSSFPALKRSGASLHCVFADDSGYAGLVCSTAQFVNGVKDGNGDTVVSTRGAAVADATGAGDVVAQLNTLLARLRTHGLIAT